MEMQSLNITDFWVGSCENDIQKLASSGEEKLIRVEIETAFTKPPHITVLLLYLQSNSAGFREFFARQRSFAYNFRVNEIL